MKIKGVKSLILLPLLAAGLSSCGDSGPTADVTIKFWHTFGQTIIDGLNEKIREFSDLVKAEEGVSVAVDLKYQGGYDDIAKKISDGYSVYNRPTIAVAYPDNVSDYIDIGRSAGKEFVVNLDKFINDPGVTFGSEAWLGDDQDEDDFVPEFYEEGSKYIVEGTYSLPFMKSTEIMFFNMNMMKDVMKGIPGKFEGYNTTIGDSSTKINAYLKSVTWSEFLDLLTFVNEHKADISNVLEVPLWYDSDANFLISKMFQRSIGYSSVSPEGTGVIEFESGTNRTKLQTLLTDMNKKYNAGLFTTKGIKNTYGSDFFTGEKCMFSVGSTGGSGYNFPEAEAFELGVCRVPPESSDKALYVSQGPTLALFSDDGLSEELNNKTQLYAWKFLKYITSSEVNAEMCCNHSEGYVPVRSSSYETAFFQEYMEEPTNRYADCYRVILNDININAGYLVSPAFKGSAALRDECGTLFTAAITNPVDTIDGYITTAITNAKLKF